MPNGNLLLIDNVIKPNIIQKTPILDKQVNKYPKIQKNIFGAVS